MAVILLVRLVAPGADPPAFLSWSTGPYTDEGFYTLDARHQALFGHPAPGDFHDRLLSPLLSWLQQAVFAVCGPGLLPARFLCVAFSLGTLCLLWLGLRRVWGTPSADWGLLLLGLAPPYVFSNRLALQETPTVFWLVLAFTLWSCGRRAALSGVALGLAVVFKPLALLALPAFLVAAGTPPARLTPCGNTSPPLHPAAEAPRAGAPAGEEVSANAAVSVKPAPAPAYPSSPAGGGGEPKRDGGVSSPGGVLAGGFLAVLALYAFCWYLPHHAELSRMATFYRVHQMQPHSPVSLWLNVRRGLTGGERGVVPYLLALMPVPCLLAAWSLFRRPTPPELKFYWGGTGGRPVRFFTLWLLCGLAFSLLSSYAPSRYYVLFLPALAALAARGAVWFPRASQVAAALAFLLTSGFWYAQAWTHRTYARQDAAWTLARTLPPGSVVVGEFAPALCLDTGFAAAPVQPGLSNDDHPVERLHATHVAVTHTRGWQAWWRARYPGVLLPPHRVATFTLGGSRHYVVDIYAVTEESRKRLPK